MSAFERPRYYIFARDPSTQAPLFYRGGFAFTEHKREALAFCSREAAEAHRLGLPHTGRAQTHVISEHSVLGSEAVL